MDQNMIKLHVDDFYGASIQDLEILRRQLDFLTFDLKVTLGLKKFGLKLREYLERIAVDKENLDLLTAYLYSDFMAFTGSLPRNIMAEQASILHKALVRLGQQFDSNLIHFPSPSKHKKIVFELTTQGVCLGFKLSWYPVRVFTATLVEIVEVHTDMIYSFCTEPPKELEGK